MANIVVISNIVGDMKIFTVKATAGHSNDMMPHCHGAEKTLISCFSPEPVVTACYYLLVKCNNSTEHIMSSTQTLVIRASNTPLPTGMSSTPTVQHTTRTPIITVSNTPLPTPTDMSGTKSDDGGVPIAGIAVAIVVLILVILLVILLIVIISRKNRHHKVK